MYYRTVGALVPIGRALTNKKPTKLDTEKQTYRLFDLQVQCLLRKRWTYKSKFCVSVCLSIFHSVSNYVGPTNRNQWSYSTIVQSYTVLASRARVKVKKRMIREGFNNISFLGIKLHQGPGFRQWFTQIF